MLKHYAQEKPLHNLFAVCGNLLVFAYNKGLFLKFLLFY